MRPCLFTVPLIFVVGCGSQSEPAPAIAVNGQRNAPSKITANAESAPPTMFGTVIDSGSRPRPRAGHELVFHDRLKVALLVNGAEDEGPATKVWGWDGRTWSLLADDGPSPRGLGGVAYDEKRGLLVLCGGRSQTQDHTDMWTWDGRRWEKINATPGAVSNHFFMVRDPDRDRIVLFGGQEAVQDQKMRAKELRETWEWDGAKWTKVASTGPTTRSHYALTYDGGRREALLFGGGNNDFWKWDGQAWKSVGVSVRPPARWGARMAYDANAKQIVLFGGRSGTTLLDDTWLWDGTKWTQAKVSGRPSRRSHHAMTYDPLRKKIILFGGIGVGDKELGDTWEWDGSRWRLADAPARVYRANAQRTGVYNDKPLSELSRS